MSKYRVLDTEEDFKWLFETHLKKAVRPLTHGPIYLEGNEDCPTDISILKADRHDAPYIACWKLNENGDYIRYI